MEALPLAAVLVVGSATMVIALVVCLTAARSLHTNAVPGTDLSARLWNTIVDIDQGPSEPAVDSADHWRKADELLASYRRTVTAPEDAALTDLLGQRLRSARHGEPGAMTSALIAAEQLAAWNRARVSVLAGDLRDRLVWAAGWSVVGACVAIAAAAWLVGRGTARLRRYLDEIRAGEARLQHLVDNGLDAIVSVGADQRIVLFNRTAEQIFARSREDVLGRTVDLLVPEEHRLGHAGRLARYLDGSVRSPTGSLRITGTAERRDGSRFPFESTMSMVVIDGQPIATAQIRDISDRIDLEKARNEALARAEASERAKGRFVAVMCHEIRNPLAAIISMLDLAAIDPGSADLGAARTAAGDLLRILNDALDLERMAAGALPLEILAFSPSRLISEVVALHAAQAREKGLDLHHADSGLPADMVGDPFRIRQMLNNIVGNAVKFTRSGRVSVTAAGIHGGGLRIIVEDTGPGLDPQVRDRLFQPFAQGDPAMARRFGGSGLGLSICKQLCERMGGSIAVESELGRGCRFTIELPPAIGSRPAQVRPLPAQRGGDRVLVVDDAEVNLTVAKALLAAAGCHVTTTTEGAEAVRMASTHQFDLIFIDRNMPGMDGLATLRGIQASADRSRPSPRCIALTASTSPDERRRMIEEGFDEVLGKPLDLDDLRQLHPERAQDQRLMGRS
jgi:two-component system sensor histidine kinase/response regulator